MPDSSSRKQLLGASATVLEMAFLSGLGTYVGYRLDARFHTSPLLILVGLALPLGLGMYLLIRKLDKLDKTDKTDDDDPPTHLP